MASIGTNKAEDTFFQATGKGIILIMKKYLNTLTCDSNLFV